MSGGGVEIPKEKVVQPVSKTVEVVLQKTTTMEEKEKEKEKEKGKITVSPELPPPEKKSLAVVITTPLVEGIKEGVAPLLPNKEVEETRLKTVGEKGPLKVKVLELTEEKESLGEFGPLLKWIIQPDNQGDVSGESKKTKSLDLEKEGTGKTRSTTKKDKRLDLEILKESQELVRVKIQLTNFVKDSCVAIELDVRNQDLLQDLVHTQLRKAFSGTKDSSILEDHELRILERVILESLRGGTVSNMNYEFHTNELLLEMTNLKKKEDGINSNLILCNNTVKKGKKALQILEAQLRKLRGMVEKKEKSVRENEDLETYEVKVSNILDHFLKDTVPKNEKPEEKKTLPPKGKDIVPEKTVIPKKNLPVTPAKTQPVAKEVVGKPEKKEDVEHFPLESSKLSSVPSPLSLSLTELVDSEMKSFDKDKFNSRPKSAKFVSANSAKL